MTDLQNNNHLRASWRGQSCDFVVTFPDTQELLNEYEREFALESGFSITE